MDRMTRRKPFRVSVIMPCHNAGRWIVEALRSVAKQTLPVEEIIVIDDGSTDDSMSRIKQSGIAVKLLHVNVGNAAAARNAGIAVATGDWIALLDADDVWYPDHLARAAELLGPGDDIAFMANHDWISLESEPIPIPDAFVCKLAAPASGMSFDEFFRIGKDGFHFGHSTVIYRRDSVLKTGMFDVTQKRRHDIDLWLRMIAQGTWTYDTVRHVGYREATPNSISKNELECDYYNLRALVKNAARVDSPLLLEHLAREARRAMGIAFVDPLPGHYARIRELAWPHLPVFYKVAYRFGEVFPGLVRGLIRTKRRLVMRLPQAAAVQVW